MIRILYVVTHAKSAGLLSTQMSMARRAGFHVGFVSSPGYHHDRVAHQEGVNSIAIPLRREIALFADLVALVRLVALMYRWKPDIVNASTPKAGLLGMLAARIAGVPVRVYTLRGLRMETTSGLKRAILGFAERVASACSHEVIAISRSLAERYVHLGLAHEHKVRVLEPGSSKGVDYDRFAYPSASAVESIRERLKLNPNDPVIGYVGRLTRDKGIPELVDAFDLVSEMVPHARLLLVGDFETGDPIPGSVVSRIQANDSIILAGVARDTAPMYALMDVLAFPSFREGFGNVALEAAAAGIPVVGFRATGIVDAVVDGVTGTLVDVGDVHALASRLTRYLEDEQLRTLHGLAGRERARVEFQPERIWNATLNEYDRLLTRAGRSWSANDNVGGHATDVRAG